MKKAVKPVDKVYKLKREQAPLSYTLPSRNTARFPLMYFDEDNNVNRALRYARNQRSPFEDEQDGNAILEPIVFEDGLLFVPKNNPVLQEFLYYHPMNGRKFVEVDDEKDAAIVVENLNAEVDALIEARGLDISMAESVGRVLFNKDVSKMSSAEIKRDILVYAKNHPKDFLNVLNDPMLKLQSTVHLLFDKKILSFRKNKKEVWYNTSSNKTRMLVIPFGEDPHYIVASFLSSDEGIESLRMLENLLEE
jgi:hypothetical protein